MSLRGKEAVKIRGLAKTFKSFRKPPFQAVKGYIHLTLNL